MNLPPWPATARSKLRIETTREESSIRPRRPGHRRRAGPLLPSFGSGADLRVAV